MKQKFTDGVFTGWEPVGHDIEDIDNAYSYLQQTTDAFIGHCFSAGPGSILISTTILQLARKHPPVNIDPPINQANNHTILLRILDVNHNTVNANIQDNNNNDDVNNDSNESNESNDHVDNDVDFGVNNNDDVFDNDDGATSTAATTTTATTSVATSTAAATAATTAASAVNNNLDTTTEEGDTGEEDNVDNEHLQNNEFYEWKINNEEWKYGDGDNVNFITKFAKNEMEHSKHMKNLHALNPINEGTLVSNMSEWDILLYGEVTKSSNRGTKELGKLLGSNSDARIMFNYHHSRRQ